MARRYYSDEARAAALAVLDANGGLLARSAKEAGVPRSTLQLWASDRDRAALPEVRHQARESLADVYGRVADKAAALLDGSLDLLKPEDLAGNPKMLTAVNTVGGTATDKAARARGEPTERVEVNTLSPDEAVAVARKLRLLPPAKSA